MFSTSDTTVSPLGPIDPASITEENSGENEKAAPWIIRKLVGVRPITVSSRLNYHTSLLVYDRKDCHVLLRIPSGYRNQCCLFVTCKSSSYPRKFYRVVNTFDLIVGRSVSINASMYPVPRSCSAHSNCCYGKDSSIPFERSF